MECFNGILSERACVNMWNYCMRTLMMRFAFRAAYPVAWLDHMKSSLPPPSYGSLFGLAYNNTGVYLPHRILQLALGGWVRQYVLSSGHT